MEYLKEYISYLKIDKNLSKRTVEIYKRDILEFERYLGKRKTIRNIARSHIRGFLAFLAENNNQPITRRRKLTSLRTFFDYLKDEKKIKESPAGNISLPRVSQNEPNYLTEIEIRKILKQIRKDKSQFKKRNLLMVRILVETGLRLNELTGLEVKDADTKNLTLRVIRKGGARQEIPINKDLGRLIEIYIKDKKLDEPLFKSNQDRRITNRRVGLMFQKYVSDAQIQKEKISVHSTRHSFCTRLLDKGVNIKAIQILAGHRSIATTERYLHIAKSRLRKEVRLAEI